MSPGGGKAWASLSLYESPELARRLAEERTGRRPTDAKAREISAHFSQGREYFRSAAGAGELVRSLILYYGAVALARGAILFLDPKKTKVEVDHGLRSPGWDDLLAKPGAVADGAVGVKARGTFPELARVTGNADTATVRVSDVPYLMEVRSPGSDVEEGTSLTIKEVLGQLPEVAGLYERAFGEHSARLRCELELTSIPEPDLFDASVSGAIEPHQKVRRQAKLGIPATPTGLPPVRRITEGLGEDRAVHRETGTNLLYFAREPVHMVVKSHLFTLLYDGGSQEKPLTQAPIATLPGGVEYLKLPTAGGTVLSALLALHLVAYAASTLVRYHPGYWAMLVGKAEGAAVAPVLSAAISAVEERYPALILEAIGG